MTVSAIDKPLNWEQFVYDSGFSSIEAKICIEVTAHHPRGTHEDPAQTVKAIGINQSHEEWIGGWDGHHYGLKAWKEGCISQSDLNFFHILTQSKVPVPVNPEPQGVRAIWHIDSIKILGTYDRLRREVTTALGSIVQLADLVLDYLPILSSAETDVRK